MAYYTPPRLTLSQRILVALGSVLIFSSGVAIYIFVSMQTLETLSAEKQQVVRTTQEAYTLEIEALHVMLLLRRYRDTKDEKLLSEMQSYRAQAAESRAQLRRHTRLPAVTEALDQYEALLPQRIALANVIVAGVQLRRKDSELAYTIGRREQLDTEVRGLLARIIEAERHELERMLQVEQKTQAVLRRNVLVAISITLLIVTGLLYSVIAGGVTRRLNQLTAMARRIAAGDFSQTGTVQGSDEIAVLARTFNEMAGQLAEFDKVKEEFVALASHQLRTPATAVKGNLGMLLEGYCGELSAEQLEILNDANQSNERQLAVINDMLYVARTEAGRLVLTQSPTDLSKLVDEAAAEQKHAIAARQQTLSVEKLAQPILLHLDTEKMRMVIGNLLSNASKYTPDGGTISIVFRPGRKNPDKEVAISISDSGVGIEKDDMAKLFSKFSRIANPLSDKVGGTGLGLFLANEIVKLHGGSIFVNSTLGEGSTFTIVIPK